MTMAEIEAEDEEPPEERDPTQRYARYKEILGKGSFKKVYKAFDKVDGVEVAWYKIDIDDRDYAKLRSQVQLLKSLRHKNITKFHGYWIDEGNYTLNIVTELFTSGSLKQFCRKHKKVDIKAVKNWGRQILAGLDYLHSHDPPIIHGDLKCDNIFINGNHGEVKIGDLGFATILRSANARSVVGTLEFTAPELYDEKFDELVDIYSFGLCLLEMVTCEYPYSECSNPAQIFKKVYSGVKPASLSKVSDLDLKLFIEKCLVPVAYRPSAKELLRDPFLQTNGEREEEPAIITIIISEDDGLFIHMIKRGINYKLRAMMIDEKAAKLEFRNNIGGDTRKTVEFYFYIESDTALSIARDMVIEQYPNHNVKVIAELIDLCLANLIPNWKPSVPIHHLKPLIETQTSNVVGPGVSLQPTCTSPCYVNMKECDQGSTIPKVLSLSNATSTKCSMDTKMSTKSTSTDECYNDKDMGTNMGSTDGSFASAEEHDDNELKTMLEQIELQYQQEMEAISIKRQENITTALNRFALGNIRSDH
ncbi:non-specific serine/threonine protein kinase [Ranunculus cassubicifolius]